MLIDKCENIVAVLIRLHNEAKECKKTNLNDYQIRANGIKRVLEQVETKLNEDIMFRIFIETNKRLGETLNPLDAGFVVKLMDKGFVINKIYGCLTEA